jgi:hypothetical protein
VIGTANSLTAGARAVEFLAGAPLDDRDVDSRQRQFAGQHQPGRASSGNHHLVSGPRLTLASLTMVGPRTCIAEALRHHVIVLCRGLPEGRLCLRHVITLRVLSGLGAAALLWMGERGCYSWSVSMAAAMAW